MNKYRRRNFVFYYQNKPSNSCHCVAASRNFQDTSKYRIVILQHRRGTKHHQQSKRCPHTPMMHPSPCTATRGPRAVCPSLMASESIFPTWCYACTYQCRILGVTLSCLCGPPSRCYMYQEGEMLTLDWGRRIQQKHVVAVGSTETAGFRDIAIPQWNGLGSRKV